MNKIQQRILKAAQDAYPEGDEFIKADSQGDGLATFIFNEIMDVTEGCTSTKSASRVAERALERARIALVKVIEAVSDGAGECICEDCGQITTAVDLIPLGGEDLEAMAPGGEVPAGRCPNESCGAFCYLNAEESEFGQMCKALDLLVDLVNVTGGVVEQDNGLYAPVADEDWLDLGEAYMKACDVTCTTPKVRKDAT